MSVRMFTSVWILALSVLLSNGCASMFNWKSQVITATASNNQKGIAVQVHTESVSYTTQLPTTIVAQPTQEGVKIKVVDDCYQATEQEVNQTFSFWFFANVTTYLGFAVDLFTGNMWDYDSNVIVHVNKKPECSKKA